MDTRPIFITINNGIHCKSEPYPQHNFELYNSITPQRQSKISLFENNKGIAKQIDEAYIKNPNINKTQYFYFSASYNQI